MPKKPAGYQFTIDDQIEYNTQKEFQEAIKKIEKKYDKEIIAKQREIKSLQDSDPYDEDPETRNDINTASRELRNLEDDRNKEISTLLAKYPEYKAR